MRYCLNYSGTLEFWSLKLKLLNFLMDSVVITSSFKCKP